MINKRYRVRRPTKSNTRPIFAFLVVLIVLAAMNVRWVLVNFRRIISTRKVIYTAGVKKTSMLSRDFRTLG